jgi:DNA-binding XRE family transcriptional regulator
LELGVAQSSSNTSVSVDLMVAFAKVFGVTAQWLLTEFENPTDSLPKDFDITEQHSPKPKNYYARIVGDNIRRLRMDRGWSQTQLAEEVQKKGIRLDNPRVSRIETGSGNSLVYVDLLMALAEILGTTVHRLLEEPQVCARFSFVGIGAPLSSDNPIKW